MAKARTLDKRRNSIRNIRKITRTMELIANARFKKAMDRANSASAYTTRITRLVADVTRSGLTIEHPLLEGRPHPQRVVLLVLTANRGMCGGFNSSILRLAMDHHARLSREVPAVSTEVSGKRGISALRYRRIDTDHTYTHFEDRPAYHDVEVLANRYLEEFITGKIDRLDVVYTKFWSSSRQEPVCETLLPLGALEGAAGDETADDKTAGPHVESAYEFLPSAESILREVVPTSFRVKLFKCFLDAAVSEHLARMIAMKAATENADEIIRQLSMTYNRARQSQITGEIMEIIGGVEALQA
ncbi:MAG: ATP synthase F1 subunit gamma [Pirellulaceae bacterium]